MGKSKKIHAQKNIKKEPSEPNLIEFLNDRSITARFAALGMGNKIEEALGAEKRESALMDIHAYTAPNHTAIVSSGTSASAKPTLSITTNNVSRPPSFLTAFENQQAEHKTLRRSPPTSPTAQFSIPYDPDSAIPPVWRCNLSGLPLQMPCELIVNGKKESGVYDEKALMVELGLDKSEVGVTPQSGTLFTESDIYPIQKKKQELDRFYEKRYQKTGVKGFQIKLAAAYEQYAIERAQTVRSEQDQRLMRVRASQAVNGAQSFPLSPPPKQSKRFRFLCC